MHYLSRGGDAAEATRPGPIVAAKTTAYEYRQH